jgi:O-antigen/teichoic acid export membrane protein
VDTRTTSSGRTDRVRHNAAFALAAQLTGAALTGGLTIFLGAQLSAHQYGLFAFAVSAATLVTLLADLGVAGSGSRYLAEHRNDPAAARAIFATAFELKLLLGGVSALALFALAAPIADAFNTPGAAGPLRGVAIAMFGQSMFLLLFGALDAMGRIRYRLLIAAGESVVEVAASVGLVLAGTAATGAAFGRAIGYAFGLALGIVVMARLLGGLRAGGGDASPVSRRQILVYAGPLLVIDAAFRVFGSIDVLLIAGILGGGAPVAAFELPMRLVVFLDYLPGAVASAVAPRLAAREGGRPDAGLFAEAMRWLVLAQVAVLPPLLVWPEAIFQLLFGGKYPDAPAVLRALVPFAFLSGVAQLATLGVNYLGYATRRIPFALAMLAVNAIIDIVLLKRIGVVAGAIGTSAAYAVWVPAHLGILQRRLGLPLGALARTTACALLAGAAACGVLLALGTGAVPLGRMLAGAVLFPMAYVGVLVAVGELPPALVRATIARVAQRRSSSA